jgi:hypothetical protein
MKRGVVLYVAGAGVLLALAGCGRSLLQMGERESWRHTAEVECLKSGTVKIGTGVVQIQPIEGPGMCGADFPLKVAALGESGGAAMSYAEDLRPPGAIPNGSSSQMPHWPANEPRYAPPPPVQSQPIQGQSMRWTPGPPAVEPAPPEYQPQPTMQPSFRPQPQPPQYQPQQTYQAQPEPPQYRPPAGRPISLNPPGVAPYNDDIPDDAVLPPGRAAPRPQQPAYNAPVYQPPQQQQRPLPSLGPSLGPTRGPQMAAAQAATLTPAATLACPLVSALDRWVSEGVQPAAMRWFGAQVIEIKQISAYSCRSMVGDGSSHISEHAFGNALDVAGFIFADGRKVLVRDGWHGTPEEQGFLHDVQLYACETFTTVLAPGYNAAHYDHIHVDLMRRDSGRRPCRPNAISGEVAAAKARAVYASKQRGPAYTGSIASAAGPHTAVPGNDGFIQDEEDDPPPPLRAIRNPAAARAGDAAIRAEERRSAIH